MFTHILIPTDFGGRASHAIDIGLELARPRSAEVRLLHVIQTIAGAGFDELESFYAELEARARHRLTELAAGRDQQGASIQMEVTYGTPATEVLRVCSEREIDLIVLASHAVERGQSGTGWGTLSYKVGLLAPCPVLLVK
jgi:nucleotide-binding universal stress UspA family protein